MHSSSTNGGYQNIAIQAKTLYEKAPSVRTNHGQPTVFHQILNSNLPAEERRLGRLASDAGALIGAGTVTTAWAVTTAVFYLLRNPHCLQTLKQELDDVWSSGSERTEADVAGTLPILEKLPYLSAVIQEALRLSNGVASRLQRIAPDETLTVRPDNGKNRTGNLWMIPPGTPVSMTQLLIFRDERIFPAASHFRPERWIEDPRLDRYQVAFCKGSRSCLGKHLALAELYIVLATIFTAYGSRSVRMPRDIGYLELWETDESDVECSVDAFVPLPKVGTKGVRCKVHFWEKI